MSIRYRNYILFYLKTLCIVVLIFFNKHLLSQQVFYQDICNCGVTGAGFSTGMGSGSGSFDIHIEPGSVIKRAFIFVQRFGDAKDTIIQINNISYSFNSSNQVSADVIFPNTPVYSAIHAIDITNDIQSSQNTYDVTIPAQFENSFGVSYGNVYLYVIYEKSNLPISTFSIFLNNYDMTNYEQEYHTSDLNPIVTNFPVGFAIYTDRINAVDLHDGSYIYLNGNLLGLLKGTDQVNNLWEGAGVKGHFYYQDNQLYGLDDDFPNNTMGGSDGLADISVYLNNFATTLNWTLKWEGINTYYNIYSGFFLTHTTPCDTFTTTLTPDTTICYGETLQLNATGGVSTGSTTGYEWTALTDSSAIDVLSCTDCPNPVFTGNSSQVYTVRIWNTDSCSVVKPVRIGVSQPQKMSFVGSNTSCTSFTGKIQTLSDTSFYSSWFAVTTNGDTLTTTSNALNNLSAGEYIVSHTNNDGCIMQDTVLTIGLQNNTVANFSVQPPSGTVPFQVDIGNLSQNATDFQWQLNGIDQGSSFTGFTADKAGVYVVQLIAWSGLPECADTVERFVVAYSNGDILISEAFSPNDDAKNEVFYIEGLENFPNTKVWIYNRWGNLVFHSENYQNDWNGISQSGLNIGGSQLPEGTYYYVVELGGDLILEKDNSVKTGFVVLRR